MTKIRTLSSSRFPAAIGTNPYKSRQELWREMTGRKEPDQINSAMQWGMDNEYRAVAAAEAVSGIMFNMTGKNQKKHYIDPPFGVMADGFQLSSTPDGRAGRTGLEVKCPMKLYEFVPEHYMTQVQGQMYVCGFDDVIFGAWTHDGARVWHVPRSEEYITIMLNYLARFVNCLMIDEEPPRFSKKKNPKPQMPVVPVTLIQG